MTRNPNTKFRLLIVLNLIPLTLVLFFGLWGKGFHFSNDVAWIKSEPGIRFGNYGVAYTHIDDQTKSKISSTDVFSIEIAFRSEDFNLSGFNLIFSIHDGRDSDQLIVGQYKSSIIVMNGDDYAHKRKTKRIYTGIFSKPPKKWLLTITSGNEGTKLYLDGRLIQDKPHLVLRIPDENNPAITLGNSVHGNNSWRGEVYGLALHADQLKPGTIENRFRVWSRNQTFSFTKDEKPLLCFTFNEGKGTETIDNVMRIQKLSMPASFHILKKLFIIPPWSDFQANTSYFMDIIVNLLGFIPSGFALCTLLIQCGGILRKKAVLLSTISCFLLSLIIEIAQAWMPSRSSQGLDVIMNTLGAWIGTIIYQWNFRRN
jgi:VanZ family protein